MEGEDTYILRRSLPSGPCNPRPPVALSRVRRMHRSGVSRERIGMIWRILWIGSIISTDLSQYGGLILQIVIHSNLIGTAGALVGFG